MNKEQLLKGEKLQQQIEALDLQKLIWAKADKIQVLKIYSKPIESHSASNYDIKEEYVDFEVLQTLTLKTIDKKLSALKEEFENL